MAETTSKKIWLQVKRLYLEEGEASEKSSETQSIVVCEGQTGNQIKEEIFKTCNLDKKDKLVLKLRNHRGSIIPITAKLPANTNSGPYVLEIVKEHQFIKAQPRSMKWTYSETMKEKIEDVLNRVEKLEKDTPGLDERKKAKIQKEMEELQQTLEFLNKRFSDAEAVHWKGMFKKNPLW